MNYETNHVLAIQQAASNGMKPHEIVALLLNRLRSERNGPVSVVEVEYLLMKGFNIPLRVLRDIEPWRGFSDDGIITDIDIDVLLGPWIAQYKGPEL
jgi:hypothetical protein